MLDLMTRAKDAINAYNTQLRINSANIANMSTPGYKSLKISFQSIFEQLINGGTTAQGLIGGTNPLQMGGNVGISSTSIDFSQGSIQEGATLDLAINGSGLFAVSPDGGNTMLYTRTGKFQIDSNGNLLTDNGLQVYGLKGGALQPITGLNGFNTSNLSWAADGRLVEYTDSTFTTENRDTGFSAALTSFTNVSGLAQSFGNTFAETEASGAPLSYQGSGGTFGAVVPRSIEASNVFFTGEIIDSQEAQRAMSGNLSMLKMISDEITNFINKIS
jgi:flagellar hook protein FlgE